MNICPQLQDYAQKHHTPAEEFVRAGWSPDLIYKIDPDGTSRPALRFKTETGFRYRFVDGRKPKYINDKGYKPCWSGLHTIFRRWPDTPYIVECNGNPSTIAAQYRGIPAFSLQAGEGARIRADLLEQVKTAFSGTVIVAYDCDEHGKHSAVERVREWRRAGFDCYAVDLDLGIDGGDLADFVATGKSIVDCKRLEIPAEPERKVTRHNYTFDTQDDLLYKVEIALDALSMLRCDDEKEWSKVGQALKEGLGDIGLPLFDAWSARSTKYKPGDCERRWKMWRRHELNIGSIFFWADEDSGKSWRERLRKKTTKIAKNKPAPMVGLPDSIRSALLNYAHQSVAPVAEVWTEAIQTGALVSTDTIDAKRLREVSIDLKRPISDRTIRAGLTHGTGLFFAKRAHVLEIQKEETLDSGIPSGSGIPGAGRKSQNYELLPMAQVVKNLARASVAPILEKCFPPDSDSLAPVCTALLESLGLSTEDARAKASELRTLYGSLIRAQPGYKTAYYRARAEYERFVRSFANLTSTHIPHDLPITTGGDYVASFARATILAAKGQVMQKGRAWWRERLGVKDRALPTVWRKAGIEVEKKVLLARPITSAADLASTTLDYDFERAGKPEKLVSSLEKKPLTFAPDGPVLRWLQEQLDKGATVSLMYHQANRQRLAPPAKRFIYAAIAAVERLIGWVLDKLKPPIKQLSFIPDEPASQNIDKPLDEPESEPVDERFTYKPAKTPAPPEPTYAERWVKNLFAVGTTFDIEGEQATDLTSGEIVPYSTQLALDLLLQPTGTSP